MKVKSINDLNPTFLSYSEILYGWMHA